MSEASVGVQFNPGKKPGLVLSLDPEDSERLFLRPRLHFGRVGLGLLVLGFASYGQLDAWSEREWPNLAFATLAAFAGVAVLTLGRRRVLNRRESEIESTRGVFWPHFRKNQTLAGFDRVSIAREDNRSSKGEFTTFAVSLEGRKQKIVLDTPGYWEPARNLAEEVAAFLHLPLHDPQRSGKLRPEELDQTESGRSQDLDPPERPRKPACQIEISTDELLRIRVPPPDYLPFLGIAIIVGLFFMIPLTLEVLLPLLAGRSVDWLSGAIPIVLPLWVFYEMASAVVTNGGVLEVTPGTFRLTQTLPWRVRSVSIPASELEDLVILDAEAGGPRTMLAQFGHGVLVARSDRESVRIGYGLHRIELIWLRTTILRMLAAKTTATPRPKRHATASPATGRAWFGLIAGIAIAHLSEGLLAVCIALPFLQHVASVGGALGLSAGLLGRRLVRPAIFSALFAALLMAGDSGRSDLVQERPALRENPRYLTVADSLDNPRYLTGFLSVAGLVNIVIFELGLSGGEALWRRVKPRSASAADTI